MRSLSLFRVVLIFVGLAFSMVASGQPANPNPRELTPSLREQLAQAAGDLSVPSWQRDYMLRLAHGDEGRLRAGASKGTRSKRDERTASVAVGAWIKLLDLSKSDHSAIYDPLRDRMVVFGGNGLNGYVNEVWTLSLAGDPIWTELVPTGTPPEARCGHNAIYDSARDRMVVFGGIDSDLNEVWALTLAGTPSWTQLTPTGTPPNTIRNSSIYDPIRDRMVVFGGYGGYRTETFVLTLAGTPAWAHLTPSGTPPSSAGHSAIYDPIRDRMVVFGGDGFSIGPQDKTWALSLAGTPEWTELTPTGTPPSGRTRHAAIYDSMRDRMIVFGGYGSSTWHNDVWALSLAGTPAWSSLTPTGTLPGGRQDHSAIYDPVRDRLVAYGGYNVGGFTADFWALSLANTPAWTTLTLGGPSPSVRRAHTAIYDPLRECMVMFGGSGVSGARNDVWKLTLAGDPEWTELLPVGTPPSARDYHTAIYDPIRDRMLVFGGYSSTAAVWALSFSGTPTWTVLATTGSSPVGRYGHSAIYDPVRDRMVVFGGDNGSPANDVWALSLADTPAWTEIAPIGAGPNERVHQTAIYDPVRDQMVVFGGFDGDVGLDDAWALSLEGAPVWTAMAPTGSFPPGRWGHSASFEPVLDGVLVFGGYSTPWVSDVWLLSLSGTPEWIELAPTGVSPSARWLHSAIYDPIGTRMVVFGGEYLYPFNDVWALSQIVPLDVDEPRSPSSIISLHAPIPNPARGPTTLTYSLARAGRVHLGVYDLSGRVVRILVDGERSAGEEQVVWDGTGESGSRLETGVYFIRLMNPGARMTQRLILLR